MANQVICNKEDLVAIANILREKTDSQDKLKFPDGFLTSIEKAKGEPTQLGEKLYRFGVLSDIHIYYDSTHGVDRFDNALTTFEAMGCSLVCTSGDIADTSRVAEMQSYKTVCDNHPNIEVHTCTGNHDKTISDEDWLTYTSHERNYEVVHNGDIFLFMSIDYPYVSSTLPYTNAIEWIEERLDRYKGARFFIFMHFPPSGYSGLLEGQYYGFSNDSVQDDELITMLNKTKNVTVFHGHSHYSFDIEKHADALNIYKFNSSHVNLIHVPSINYVRNENSESNWDVAQGFLVDVYDKGFVVTGVDLLTGTEMKEHEYIITIDNNPDPISNAIMVNLKEAELYANESVIGSIYLAEPANATVTLSSNNNAITVTPSELTFTTDNYNVAQTFTITAPAEITDTQGYIVTLSSGTMTKRTISIVTASSIPTIASTNTWYRSETPRNTFTTINIVNSTSDVPATYTETWDASEGETGAVNAYVDGTILYIAGNGSGSIATTSSAEHMFSDTLDTDYFSNVTSINGLDLLDTSDCVRMKNMFKGCSSIGSLNLNSFNVSSVENMNRMFENCSALTSLEINNWNVSNLRYAYYLFSNCSSLTSLDLSNWYTTSLEEFSYMFNDCVALENLDISNFNTSKASYMDHLFYYCQALKAINISNFSTSRAVHMGGMFKHCETITSLDLSNFNTSNVTNMQEMFCDCVALTSLNVGSFDTSKVTNMGEMFDHCDSLTTLNISNFNTSAIQDTTGLYRFARKSGITNLTVGENFVQEANLPAAGSDGMFYTSASTPLTITGANDVFKTYDFATDNRTVTFA